MGVLSDVIRRTRRLDTYLPAGRVVNGQVVANGATLFRPNSDPQKQFLTIQADVIIYGGAAGGGKTWSLLVEALKYVRNRRFGAVLFRRTYPQITNEGGLWDESQEIYPLAGGNPRVGDLDWTWSSGARVSFRHLLYEKELQDWMGAQICYIGFDQLEHFSEQQFWYMFSRNRSLCGVKPFMRGTVNPDADSWVADLIGWWIDQDTGYPIPERAGIVRYFIRKNDETFWADTPEELIETHGDTSLPHGHPDQVVPKSFTFIPAKVTDNKTLMEKDPGYVGNLRALGEIDRQRLLEGNWKVKPEAGKIFNRGWFEIVYQVPDGGKTVRGWDLAATEKKIKGNDPDYTASCKIKKVNGIYYIMDATAAQLSPTDADEVMLGAARRDGPDVEVYWEEEGGATGVRDTAYLIRLLVGYVAGGKRPKGDKYQRTKGFASQARAGNVKLLYGPWNKRWLSHMHGQPDLPHDDEHDAAGVAFNAITFLVWELPRSWSKSIFGRK